MADDDASGLALRPQGALRLLCECGEVSRRACRLQFGHPGGAHAWRNGLREGVPGRAAFPRIDPTAAYSHYRTAHLVIHRREGTRNAEIVLTKPAQPTRPVKAAP